MTTATIKAALKDANVPAWAIFESEGPNGEKEISVSYDELDAYADEAKIKAMKFIVTDKGLVFTA